MDRINDRWGEFVVTPALMMGMDDIILDRISFGGVKELRELYEEGFESPHSKKVPLLDVSLLKKQT
ncbi:MAG: hypothetical protein JO266_05125 [Acidobacteria bacterium]|nr:hypothetical protein [Acidobacteriota bacterium]